MLRPFLIIALATVTTLAPAAEPLPRNKLLIEFGWDEPDTAYLRKNASKMAESPFDGCVFHAAARRDDGLIEDLAWKAWGKRLYTEAELAQSRDDLKQTEFGRFRHNFLRINTAPADLDWFDDHAPVLNNLKQAASLAKAGRCRGVLLDTEQYQGQLFNFEKQKDAKSRSWDDYAKQARLRGAEVMGALQEGMPGLTVLLTFGPSYVLLKAEKAKVDPKETEYGLLVPFVEGMASALQGDSRLIDGHEPSYGYREAAEFDKALTRIRKGPRRLEAGFGLWLDYDWRVEGWDEADLEKNHFSPSTFERSVGLALERSDEIVWVYSENPRWWTASGKTEKLPKAYDEALRSARKVRKWWGWFCRSTGGSGAIEA